MSEPVCKVVMQSVRLSGNPPRFSGRCGRDHQLRRPGSCLHLLQAIIDEPASPVAQYVHTLSSRPLQRASRLVDAAVPINHATGAATKPTGLRISRCERRCGNKRRRTPFDPQASGCRCALY
jgi:hypothetical protein